MKTQRLTFLFVIAVLGCSSSSKQTTVVPAYLAGDQCHGVTDATACAADSGCKWLAIVAEACAPGTTCPTGVCVAVDPCAAYSSQSACTADTSDGCAWAGVTSLCPAGSACGSDGFCYQPMKGGTGGGCACACPDFCLAGQPCPPCACDCPPEIVGDAGPTMGGGGGGGTCTCGCPACAPGETCPPCDCNCMPSPTPVPDLDGGVTCVGGGGGEGSGGGTCTCNCPICPPGEVCPDVCACSCTGDAGVPMNHKEPAQPLDAGVCICNCPACILDGDAGSCPPCDCDCSMPPPCR